MGYTLTKNKEAFKVTKVGHDLSIFPGVPDAGIVIGSTEHGHETEISHAVSTFTYVITKGTGTFILGDQEIAVTEGDVISIEPDTKFYYLGSVDYVLVTTPPWTEEGETTHRVIETD